MMKIFRKLFWFTDKQRRTALQKLKILGYKDRKNLTKRELIIASNLVDPKTITVSYEKIGGLSDVIDDIKKNVIIPAFKKKYKKELLPNLTKRILLHGPSGCGKTMISEAIAREEKGIYCLKLDGTLSLFSGHLDSKCRKYKENIKLIDALFNLARKLQTLIIFIDGFDFSETLIWTPKKGSKPIVADYFVKKLINTENDLIMIGETNHFHYRKQYYFDRIIQKYYHISLPNTNQRADILAAAINTYYTFEERVSTKGFDTVAIKTCGFSGYDLNAIIAFLAIYEIQLTDISIKLLLKTADDMIKYKGNTQKIYTVSEGYFALKKYFCV